MWLRIAFLLQVLTTVLWLFIFRFWVSDLLSCFRFWLTEFCLTSGFDIFVLLQVLNVRFLSSGLDYLIFCPTSGFPNWFLSLFRFWLSNFCLTSVLNNYLCIVLLQVLIVFFVLIIVSTIWFLSYFRCWLFDFCLN